MKLTSALTNKLWDELIASATSPSLGEGEKTVAMIAKEMNRSENAARNWIRRWVREGKLRYIGKRQIDLRHSADAWVVINANHDSK